MNFQVHPFWLVGAVCFLGAGILVWIVRSAYPREMSPAISAWGAANIALGIAFFMRFAQYSVHPFFFYDLSAALITLCLCLEYMAICWLKRRRPLYIAIWLTPTLILLVTSWFTFVHRNISIELIFCNGISVALLSLMVQVLLQKDGERRPFPDLVAAGAYGLMALVTSLVIFDALRVGHFPEEYNYNQPRSLTNVTSAIVIEFIVFPMFLMMASERLNRKLVELAMRDSLTGLYNRRAFEEIARREMAAAKRTGQPLALAIFDLDYFKAVNDALGHAAGDAVLLRAAETLQKYLRAEDVLCRWGGDEFCALLPHSSHEDVETAAARVRQAFQETVFEAEGHRFDLRISVGVAWSEVNENEVDELTRRADAALYLAKKSRQRGLVLHPQENQA